MLSRTHTHTHTKNKRIKNTKIHPEISYFKNAIYLNTKKNEKEYNIIFFYIFFFLPQVSIICCFFTYTKRTPYGVDKWAINIYIYIFSVCKGNKCKVSTNLFRFHFACHLNGNVECFFYSSWCSIRSVLKSIWKTH